MKTTFLTAVLLSMVICAGAQDNRPRKQKNETHIFGHVTKNNTAEHLPYINVTVKGTSVSTITDASGHYFISALPPGTYTLVAHSTGFVPQEKVVELENGASIELNFEVDVDVILLKDVVISANKNETSRKEAPLVVGVISPKVFNNTNSACLAEGLCFMPGLRLESNCQNCGFQQVRINGLDGAYSQILIDGRAVSSALSQVYGIEQIPVNMIEKVEVIRGGGSAIFGSNAVAGTINILTKEPKVNSVTVGSTLSLTGMKRVDANTILNASLVTNNNQAGITLFASARQRSPYDHDGDGFTEIGKLNARNIGFRGFIKMGIHSKLSLEYHTIHEFRRGGNKLSLPAHESDITEQTEHDIHCAGLKYDFFTKDSRHWLQVYTSLQSIFRNSYYGAGQDPNAYGHTKDLALVSGVQYVFNMKKFLFMPAALTSGIEFNHNGLYDESLGYDRVIDQKVNIYSAFIQNEWKNKKLSLLLGARLDKHNMIKKPIFSPRANVRYAPLEWMTFRAGYAKGFRAPQAFDEDLHITAVGGGGSIIRLAPDLKPEHSHSVNLSVNFNRQWARSAVDVLLEGFYTTLKDVFVLVSEGTDNAGNLLLSRQNGSGAMVAGLNVEVKYIPIRKLELQAGFTYQQSRYREPEQWSETVAPQKKMFRSPDTYGFLMLYYSPVKRLDIALSGTYTGKMLLQHFAGYIESDREDISKPFFDLNAKLSYGIKIKDNTLLEVSIGMKNIFNSYQNDFDQGEFRDAGYIYGPALPRSLFAGLKFSI